MKVVQIVAFDLKGAIGRDNKMPWRLPNDLKYFKSSTLGNNVLMGRKTFDSTGNLLGREITVATNNANLVKIERNIWTTAFLKSAVVYFKCLNSKKSLEKTLFIAGGGEIYKQTLELTDEIWATEVDTVVDDADTFYPKIDKKIWEEFSRVENKADEKHLYNYDFVKYKRK